MIFLIFYRSKYTTYKYKVRNPQIYYDFGVIDQKGMHLNYDFYIVVGKQCRTENA